METEIAIRDTVNDADDKMTDGRRRRRSTETSDEVTSRDERAPADEPPVKSESVVLLAHDTARNGKRQKMPDARSGGPADGRAGKQRYTELSDMVGHIIAGWCSTALSEFMQNDDDDDDDDPRGPRSARSGAGQLVRDP